MAPTSTDNRWRAWCRLFGRVGVPLLAVTVGVSVTSSVVGSGRTVDRRPTAPASAVEDLPAPAAPERASRSADRVEELETASSPTSMTVERVEVMRVTEERVIPTPKELHDDPALPRGETRVEADGSPGRERVVFEVTRRNGRITAKRRVSSEIITPARPRVVFVGRGGALGRGAPADNDDIPLKLRIAEEAFAAARPAGRYQEGGASWYRYKPGTCAHRTLPKGTVVKVINRNTGQSATCTVADRGPFIAGRIIDLDRSVFLAIAESPGQGVVQVRIEW